ncbi:MAG: sigma factor-like helix-turn-helix DNA-binding protein [Pseudomonadota bacterium]
MDLNQSLTAAGQGDSDAFKAFYDGAAPKVLAVLIRLFDDRFVAESVLTESMKMAWREKAKFDSSRVGALDWIVALARQIAFDHLRLTGRYRRRIGDDGGGSSSANTGDSAEGALSTLSDEQLACLELAYLDGFTRREIAIRVGYSLPEVKSWLQSGSRLLIEGVKA